MHLPMERMSYLEVRFTGKPHCYMNTPSILNDIVIMYTLIPRSNPLGGNLFPSQVFNNRERGFQWESQLSLQKEI